MKSEFLEKAGENLNAAELCFEKGLNNDCANRSYYAALQAAVAALADRGIKRNKVDHKWVQAEFNGRLINRQKIFPAKIKPYLMKMQTVRNEADYEIQQVSKKNALKQLSRAKEIVRLVRKELEK